MKTYQSTTENIWEKLNKVELTENEIALLDSEKEEDKVARKELSEVIKQKRKTTLIESESQKYIEIYNSHKPTLTEKDNYVLLAINVIEAGDIISGILNCRINGEHKQIRF